MKAFIGLSLIGTLLLRTAPLHADFTSLPNDFDAVCQALRSVALVEADFAEEKTMHLLSHPLQSTGKLMFSPQGGVYRVMEAPVHGEMLITRTQLIQKDAQGKIQRMSVRRQPAAQGFVDVFLSFFSGDQAAWKKEFDVTFTGTQATWKIRFVPHHASPVAKAIQSILLEGHQGVLDAMTLTEAKGDVTHAAYTNQHISNDPALAAARFPKDLTP